MRRLIFVSLNHTTAQGLVPTVVLLPLDEVLLNVMTLQDAHLVAARVLHLIMTQEGQEVALVQIEREEKVTFKRIA